ncbi:MAG: transcription antitermination factor NusB [Candidatus Sumerlaeia bacterium]
MAPPESGDSARLVTWLALCKGHDPQSSGAQDLLAEFARKAELSALDQGLAYEILMGSLRTRRILDKITDTLEGFQGKVIKENIREVIRIGLYQYFFMDRVPVHALVNETVEIARLRLGPPEAGFCNALFQRMIAQYPNRAGHLEDITAAFSLADRYSFPGWIVRMIKREAGPENLEAALRALNAPLPLYARANPPLAETVDVTRHLLTSGIVARPRPDIAPWCLEIESPVAPILETEIFRQGGLFIQDASSQLVAEFAVGTLENIDAPTVVDFCSAPGGKTTYLATRMQKQGQLVACDISLPRLERLRENAKRLRVSDFIEIALLEEDSRKVKKKADPSPNADLVLVDAPCSGLGTLRRHPEIRWRLSHADLHRLATLQGEILNRAARLVRPGGTLIYATCSLAPAENEAVVNAFIEASADAWEIVTDTSDLPDFLAKHIEEDGWLRLHPHTDVMDSARAVRLQRKDGLPCQ